MGFFGRLKTGWRLAMDSLRVVRKKPSLAVFPLFSGVTGLLFLTLLLGGSYVLVGAEPGPVGYAALFVTYFGLTFLTSFFNAALVHNAREVFDGRDPTVKEGLSVAWAHRTPIAVWALAAATIGVLLRAIESSDNPLANVAAMVFGVAWSLITYFIVPVIVFEDVGPGEMFKRSGETFKDTWGETAGASFGVGLVTVLLGIVGIAIAALVFVVLGGSALGTFGALAIGAAIVFGLFLFGTALDATAKTALYVYASEGRRPNGFEDVDFERPAK